MERPVAGGNEEVWRAILLGTEPGLARTRARLKLIPSAPRCKMCNAPFAGIGRPLMRVMGRDRWPKNPKYCGKCFEVLSRMHGGAEIEASFLFADVRGSTALAERMSPTAFRHRLDFFYDVASRVLIDRDGIVDKFVGDEVVAMFIPAIAQGQHASRAVEAALELLKEIRDAESDGEGLPIGVGVHTGVAFIGAVGAPPVTELTALGDVVNTTARLASAAGPGELLVTEDAARAASLDTHALEYRSLELKGKSDLVGVFVARAA